MKKWLLTVLTAIATGIFALAGGVAASDERLKPYLNLFEIVTVVSFVATVILAYFTARVESPPLPHPFDEDLFHRLRERIEEAERTIRLDTPLTSQDWATKLTNWVDDAKRLIEMAIVPPITPSEQDGKSLREVKIANEEAAQSLVYFVIVIRYAMLQRGNPQEFIDIATPAYAIALALKQHYEAACFAYHLARTHAAKSNIEKAKLYAKALSDLIEQIRREQQVHLAPTSIAQQENTSRSQYLQLLHFEIEGLLAQTSQKELFFRQALPLAHTLQERDMVGLIHQQLGDLAKNRGENEQAVCEYQEALTCTQDPIIRSKCYDNLAMLFDILHRYDDEERICKEWLQLDVGKQAKSRAYEGVGRALFKKEMSRPAIDQSISPLPEESHQAVFKKQLFEAYQHYRKALFEVDRSETEYVNNLHLMLISVIDKIIPPTLT